MEFATKARVKVFLKANGKRMGEGVFESLDEKITALLKDACRRAKENGRNTVLARDI